MDQKQIRGYSLDMQTYVKEIDGTVYLYSHNQTKAKVLYIQNGDEHKSFGIGFRTPPPDSTGVPHIIEHSVLCGSRKFPLKDPFVELAKGSLNTYLNAMTYPDKTLYPISSQNDADFHNLMDVYLDAVFFPNIHHNPYLLMQEGWRYELESEDAPLEYKGVVYNEMKGAFSSPEEVGFRKIKESLFPDTIYSNESGGAPEFIPQLTAEDFLGFHKKYYHPSNAYICLYGDIDIAKELDFIDKEYLAHFDYQEIDSSIPLQQPFDKPISKVYPYSVSEEKDNQIYVSYNYVIGEVTDREHMVAMSILEYILLDTPASPLKKALIKEGIGEDVFGVFQTHLRQPIFTIMAKNVTKEQVPRFYEVVEKTLREIVAKGISKQLLNGAIQVKEFELKEADFKGYSKGLLYFINCMKSWLYEQSPLIYLQHEEIMEKLNHQKDSGYFEHLIETYLLNNTHAVKMQLVPKLDLDREMEENTITQLNNIKDKMSQEEIEKLIQRTLDFKAFQDTPDTEEARHTIPILKKEDLSRDVMFPRSEVREYGNHTYIVSPLFTNEIAYMNWFINLEGIADQYMPYLGMVVGMLGKLDTQQRSYEDLSMYLDENLGGLEYHIQAIKPLKSEQQYHRYFFVKSKALLSKINEQVGVVKEIIEQTCFEDENRVFEIIKEMKSMMEMSLSGEGHKVAAGRLLSHFSAAELFEEETKGLAFYHFVENIYKNWDEKKADILEDIKKAYGYLANEKRITVGLTVDEESVDSTIQVIAQTIDKLPSLPIEEMQYKFVPTPIQEGLIYPGNVNYVAMGYQFKELGYTYHGSMLMLKTILSMEYLWQNVRVKNGAYGCFADMRKSGVMYFVSYRDPNITQTLEIYRACSDFIENLNLSERELVQYLIGTISGMDFPYTPSTEGVNAQMYYLVGATKEDIEHTRHELFDTTNEKLRSFAPLIKACFEQNQYCVFGNTSSIEQNQDLFKQITKI
ncbi:MAG: insulinase family protein [Cellulosilyticaceae bacterium]